MKIAEAMRKAVAEDDPEFAGKIADCLSYGLGLDYLDSFKFWNKVTGIDLETYDDLMYRADIFESQGIKI